MMKFEYDIYDYGPNPCDYSFENFRIETDEESANQLHTLCMSDMLAIENPCVGLIERSKQGEFDSIDNEKWDSILRCHKKINKLFQDPITNEIARKENIIMTCANVTKKYFDLLIKYERVKNELQELKEHINSIQTSM